MPKNRASTKAGQLMGFKKKLLLNTVTALIFAAE
jgi:hypothetical protein